MSAVVIPHPTLERSLAERAVPLLRRMDAAARERAIRALVSSLGSVSTVRVLAALDDSDPKDAA